MSTSNPLEALASNSLKDGETESVATGDACGNNDSFIRFHKNELPQNGPRDPKLQALLKLPVGKLGTTGHASQFAHRSIVEIVTKYVGRGRNMYDAMDLADRLWHRLRQEGCILPMKTNLLVIRGWGRVAANLSSEEEGTAGPRNGDDDSAFRSRRILEELWEQFDERDVQQEQSEDTQSTLPEPPATDVYNAVLAVCAASAHADARHVADSLVRDLEVRLQNNDNSGRRFPTTRVYTSLIRVHARHADRQHGAASAAEDWLMRLTELAATHASQEDAPQPTIKALNHVLLAWSISPEENGAKRALELLEMAIKLEANHGVVHPDDYTFGTVAAAFARRQKPVEAEQVFRKALSFFSSKTVKAVSPTSVDSGANVPEPSRVDLTSCLNSCIHAWAISDSPEAAERTDALLLDAYALKPGSSTFRPDVVFAERAVQVVPDLTTHVAYLQGQIRSGHILHAHQHLLDMVHFSTADENGEGKGDGTPFPDTMVFNFVIHGWLQSPKSSSSAKLDGENTLANDGEEAIGRSLKAASLIETMLEHSEHFGRRCAPQVGTFTMCIQMLCEEGHKSPAVQLLKMARIRELDDWKASASVINVLSNKSGSIDDVVNALGILSDIEADMHTRRQAWSPKVRGLYTSVISAAAARGRERLKDSAKSAIVNQVISIVDQVHSRGASLGSKSYTSVLRVLAQWADPVTCGRVSSELFDRLVSLDADPKSTLYLDEFLVRQVLVCLKKASKGGLPQYASKSCEVLSSMVNMWQANASQSEDTSIQQGNRRREDLEPSRACYDACLEALIVNPKNTDHIKRAAGLLYMIQTKFKQGNLKQSPSDAVCKMVRNAAKKSR